MLVNKTLNGTVPVIVIPSVGHQVSICMFWGVGVAVGVGEEVGEGVGVGIEDGVELGLGEGVGEGAIFPTVNVATSLFQ